MDTNKMREQFESFAREVLDWSDDEFRLASDGKSYYWGTTGEAWVFWQASRKAVVVELPKVVGFEGAYDSHRHHEFVPSMSDVEDADEIFGLCRSVEAKEAIEAQGLKVAP
ncbi:TPA: hypothetical protein QDZ28_000215 [Pseudomonas putida]|nr:hypothetical protein [Pseudomonas putida]